MDPKRGLQPWYKKKIVTIPAALLGLFFVLNGSSTANSTSSSAETLPAPIHSEINLTAPQPVQVNVAQETEPILKGANTAIEQSSGLSNDNYYTNSKGNSVHSPAYSDSVPVGASAQCRDGTYSFSQSRRGTCSHHGGVASWL